MHGPSCRRSGTSALPGPQKVDKQQLSPHHSTKGRVPQGGGQQELSVSVGMGLSVRPLLSAA